MAKNKQDRPAKPVKGQVRQGDVLVTPADTNIKKGKVRKPEHNGRDVLAHGEVTGHSHDIADADVSTQYESLEFQGESVLDVTEKTTVVHQEHEMLDIGPGTYTVRRKSEWTDDDEPRQVAD